MINVWLKRLDKIENKEGLTFETIYHAIGSICFLHDRIRYVRKFAEKDSDFGTTLRAYARREYRRTGDNEIETGWLNAIHIVEGKLELEKELK